MKAIVNTNFKGFHKYINKATTPICCFQNMTDASSVSLKTSPWRLMILCTKNLCESRCFISLRYTVLFSDWLITVQSEPNLKVTRILESSTTANVGVERMRTGRIQCTVIPLIVSTQITRNATRSLHASVREKRMQILFTDWHSC